MTIDPNALVPPMTEEEISKAVRECPHCHAPTVFVGRGPQTEARLIVQGRIHDSCVDGSVTRYTCQACGCGWNIRWPDNSMPMA